MFKDRDTIIAHCTPSGAGALALLRISGTQACTIATQISRLSSGKKIDQVATHTIHHGYVVDAQGSEIDQVLFFVMHAPRTFTGEDTIEISCHNNNFIIESIIAAALFYGARLAHAGEFSRRSVEHGKIDLVQAESINELIHATTHQSLKLSLAQLQGSLSQQYTAIEKKLIKALALSEASFEFIDEDMQFGEQIIQLFNDTLSIIASLKKAYDMRQQIKEGIRIALIGSVNAGKSSLFNALLGKERAIVTPIAGTTRDVIEAGVYSDGRHMTFVDTAGLRTTEDIIEQHGIQRSFQEAHKADVVLLIIDAARNLTEQEMAVYKDIYAQYHEKIIIVGTKSDLPPADIPSDLKPMIFVSSRVQDTIVQLEQLARDTITRLCEKAHSPFLINKRQLLLLTTLEQQIILCLSSIQKDVKYEILSYTIQDMLTYCAELTGKSITHAAMDAIFREFCVGK